ncbi:MAG: GNAT family N-acetyltransferase [Steroidobacteraceae bacterium]
MTRLDSDAIFIRHLEPEGAVAMWELRVGNRDFFGPYEPERTDADFTLESIRGALGRDAEDRRAGLTHHFGIFVQDGEALVGQVRLSNVFRGPWQNANLGYSVALEHNGKGYATAAVQLACRFAFTEIALHRVQAGVMTDNDRSIRVLEKVGFRSEGLALRYLRINGAWRDHYIYAVTVEEWER